MSTAMIVRSMFERSGHDPHGYKRAAEHGLMVQVFEKLMELYPGRPWQVKADACQGIVHIRIPGLMHVSMGYILHIDKLGSEEDLTRACKEAGGHILERWRLSRNPRSKDVRDEMRAARRKFILVRHNDPIPV